MADKIVYNSSFVRNRSMEIMQSEQMKIAEKMLRNEADAFEEYRDTVLNSNSSVVATMNRNLMSNVILSNSASILKGSKRQVSTPPKSNASEKMKVYSSIHNQVIDSFNQKSATPSEFMWKTVEANSKFDYAFTMGAKAAATLDDTVKAYDYFKNSGKGAIVFDLETFGGKNEFGKQELDAITEFTFSKYDKIAKGEQPASVIKGFVGITEKQEKEFLDKFRDMSDLTKFTGKDMVTAKYLAKLGSDQTEIKQLDVRGRYSITKAADPDDIVLSKESIERGVKKAREVGILQESSRLENGMLQWEKDLADSIIDLQKGESSIVGHNIARADIPWLNQFLSTKASTQMKSYLSENGVRSLDISPTRTLDTLSALQYGSLNKDFIGELWGENEKHILKEGGHTPLQLEGLIKQYAKDLFNNSSIGAHTAEYDVAGLYEILTSTGDSNSSSVIDKALKMAQETAVSVSGEVRGDSSQLFLATSSLGESTNMNSLLGFKEDPFDGKIKTMDGFEIDGKDVKNNKGFGEWLTKKGVSYTVDDVLELQANQTFINAIKKINPTLAVEDLMAIKLSPVTSIEGVQENILGTENVPLKNTTPSYIVGTKNDVTSYINNNLVLYGEKDDQGQYKLVNGADKIISKNYLVETNEGVKELPARGKDLIQQTIKDGAVVNSNDSAARIVREMDYTKYNKYLDFVEEVEKLAKEDKSDKSANNKNIDAIKKMLSNSSDVAKKVAAGETLSEGEAVTHRTLQDILGYKDFKTGENVVHSKTVDNAIASFRYFSEMSDVLKLVNEQVEKIGTNNAEKNYLFKQGLDVVASEVEQINGRQMDQRKGYVRNFEKNYFEVDVSGITKKEKGTITPKLSGRAKTEDIVRVNLDGGEYKLINSLVDKKYTNESAEVVKRLGMFVEHIQESTGMLGGFYGDKENMTRAERSKARSKYLSETSKELFAKDILSALKQERQSDPMAGFLSELNIHKVVGATDIGYARKRGLTDSKIQSTLEARFDGYKSGTIKDLTALSKDEKAFKDMAANVVDNILMDSVSREDLSTYGYSEKQIDHLMSNRDVRKKDYNEYVQKLLRGVANTQMSLVADPKTGVFGLMKEDRFIDLSGVPRDRFSDGIFYTQVGRNKIATQMHLTVNDTSKQLIDGQDINFKSGLGVALDGSWKLDKAIENAVKRGSDFSNLPEQWVSKIASEMRAGSSLSVLDEQDLKSQFEIYDKQIINNLSRIPGLNDLDLHNKDKFLERISKDTFEFDKMQDTDKQLYQKNRGIILSHIADNIAMTDDMSDLVSNMSNRAKASKASDGAFRALGIYQELEIFNNATRGFDNSARFLSVREDNVLSRLEEMGISERVGLGAHLRTTTGHGMSSRKLSGTDTTSYTEFTVDRAIYGSDTFQQKLGEHAVDPKTALIADQLATVGNLIEGGSIANSRLGDAILENYDRQKISFERALFADHTNALEQMEEIKRMNKVIPELVFKDGKIDFEYKKGAFVKRGDMLFNETVYGDGEKAIAAKYDGALRMGFFTKAHGTIAKESEVIENVLAHAKNAGIEITDTDSFYNVAKEKYEVNFYVEKLIAEPYRKIQEDRLEKGMSTFTYTALGNSVKEDTGDKKIIQALDNLGLGSLKGRVLSKEFFDDLSSPDRFVNGVLSDISTKDLDKAGYLKAVQNAGYENPYDFKQSLMEERHMASDFMRDVFKADFLSVANDSGHKNKARPVMMAINNMVEDETQKLLSQGDGSLKRIDAEKQAASNILNELDGVFVKDGKNGLTVQDGKLIVPEFDFHAGDNIQVSKLREAYDTRMQGKSSFDGMIEEGKVNRIVIGASQDFTGMSGSGVLERDGSNPLMKDLSKGFKVTDREIAMLDHSKLTQDFIDEMVSKKAFDESTFEKAFGFATEKTEGGSYVLKDEFKNTTFMDGFIERVTHGLYAKPGEKLISEDFSDAGDLESTARALSSASGGGRVSFHSAEKAYAVGANTMAMRFNNGELRSSTLQNSQYGFDVKKFGDLSFSTGGDADWLLESHSNGIYNKNLIIDLQDEYIGSDVISRTNTGKSQIAIGKMPVGVAGNELVQKSVHKELGLIHSMRANLRDADLGTLTPSDNDIESYKNRIAESIDKINGLISESVTSKNGLIKDLSETRLEKSVIGKASLMHLSDAVKSGSTHISALENAFVDGKSILDHHKDGVLMDFKLISREQAETMGLFDEKYLKSVGMTTAEEMEATLKSGVMAMTHRNPTIYEGSLKPTTLILSDHLHGNQSVEYAAGALTSKADADGDMVKTALMEMVDENGNYVDSIQYKRGIGVDKKVETNFAIANSMMYHNAAVRNPFFEKALQEDLSDIKKYNGEMASKLTNMLAFDTDVITPGLSRLATKEEAAVYKENFNTVQNKALDIYSREQGRTIDEARDIFMEDTSVHQKYLRTAAETFDASEQGQYKQAADHYIKSMEYTAGELASLKQSSAGEINLPLYQVRKIKNLAGDTILDGKSSRILEHVLEASEEAFLSPKHSEAKMVNNSLTMEEFNRAFRSVTGNPLKGDAKSPQLMADWLENNLPGRFKLGKVEEIQGLMKENKFTKEKELYTQAANLIQDIFSKDENIARFNMYISAVGQYEKGISPDRISSALIAPKGSKELMARTYEALAESHGEAGFRMEELLSNKRLETAERLESDWRPPASPSFKDSATGFIGSIKNTMSKMNLSGKDLAFGALGIAGATMMAGFVGGNPSEKSTTTAAAGADQGNLYSIPMMTDNASGAIMANPSQGYIININASTPKGQAHAEEAIRAAMSQSYQSTNVNVSMNIQNNQSNITDRTIQSLFEGAFA